MKLETFCDQTAQDVAGVQASDAGKFGIDFPALVEMIMQIITQIMNNCPATDEAIAQAVKRPTIFQRAKFRGQVSDQCSICFRAQFRNHSGRFADSMLKRAAATTDTELVAIISEARSQDWFLG